MALSFIWKPNYRHFISKNEIIGNRPQYYCFPEFLHYKPIFKGKLIIFFTHMCLIYPSIPFLCDTYSRNINSSRAVTMLCLPIGIDFLLWTALTTKSKNYKNNLKVWKVASCVCCHGWHSEEESVKGHLSCVVFHWDCKNRSKGLSMIYELNKARDKNVRSVRLLFLSQSKGFVEIMWLNQMQYRAFRFSRFTSYFLCFFCFLSSV